MLAIDLLDNRITYRTSSSSFRHIVADILTILLRFALSSAALHSVANPGCVIHSVHPLLLPYKHDAQHCYLIFHPLFSLCGRSTTSSVLPLMLQVSSMVEFVPTQTHWSLVQFTEFTEFFCVKYINFLQIGPSHLHTFDENIHCKIYKNKDALNYWK